MRQKMPTVSHGWHAHRRVRGKTVWDIVIHPFGPRNPITIWMTLDQAREFIREIGTEIKRADIENRKDAERETP